MESELQDGNKALNISSNDGYIDASALQIRLNASPLVRKVKEYLSGIQESPNELGGLNMIKVGEPLCTDEGIRQIVNFVEMTCNPQIFQGKIDREIYGNVLFKLRVALAKYLIGAGPDIGVKHYNRDFIIDTIMGFVEIQLSGVIDGFRTTSLTPTIRTVESNTINQQSRGLFGRKR